MEAKKFDAIFIDVLARDIIDGQTVVRYMDEKENIKKLSISKVDYDILPNKKLLVAKLEINDDIIAYCKNKKDNIHTTEIFDIDEFYHGKNPQNSRFIDSDANDIKQLQIASLKRKVQPLLMLVAIVSFVLAVLLSSWWTTTWCFLLVFGCILIASCLFFVEGFSFITKSPINNRYEATYDKFKLDFDQKLTNNKHLF